MTKQASNQEALLAYLAHEVESARREQVAFSEAVVKNIENVLHWKAEGALTAVFTERHAQSTLEQIKLGHGLPLIYENLIDRLTLLASGHNSTQPEVRAIAMLLRALKDFLS